MKKNLRNILTLALGFVTIFATAQSWDADSRTRVDMGGDNDQFTTEQRTSLGVNWGGNGWGINVSATHNYDLGTDGSTMSWNEAYATTDLMGYASVAVGRQALEYGSGRLIGANDWAANPNTRDGGVFTIANDMMDLDFGVYNDQADNDSSEAVTDYFINVSKSDGDWSVNLTYISNGDESNAMGLDFGYAMMGGDLDLAVSYNTASDGVEGSEDMGMMSLGATYNVNDNMSISATRSTSGDGGFAWGGSNYGNGAGSWGTHGNMGNLSANDEDLAVAVTYAMGDFSIGIGMHKVTNTGDDMGDYERNVTEANLSYTMSDNANVSIKYATDNAGVDMEEDKKYMWLTLSITP
jgi:hypothetical protein